MRVVSLVPSLTEAIAVWGGLESLVGRTRYCVEPAGAIERVEALGGTKNPDITRIVEIRPDLVVVNREENRKEDHDALVAAGLQVFVTHPRTVRAAAGMFVELGGALGRAAEGEELAERTLRALDAAGRISPLPAMPRAFCPIWRNPWMTFHSGTYVGDMLTVAGLDNVFGAESDRDFFDVSIDEVRTRRPDIVLLPDEPYIFEAKHAEELERQGVEARFELLCGKDLSWYGPRTPDAIARLTALVER
jgi:ABC-type Fe3+-hydroxamate transport system substrate-binding protein